MFTVPLFRIANNWKEPSFGNFGEWWITCDTYIYEHYSAMKKMGLLTNTTTQMNFKCIRLQSQQSTYHTIPFLYYSGKTKTIGSKAAWWLPGLGVILTDVRYQEARRNFLRWWKCSMSWLWRWLYNCIHLSNTTELYTTINHTSVTLTLKKKINLVHKNFNIYLVNTSKPSMKKKPNFN